MSVVSIVGYITLTLLGLIWIIAGLIGAFRCFMEAADKQPWAARGFGKKASLVMLTLLMFLVGTPVGFLGSLLREGYDGLDSEFRDALYYKRRINRRKSDAASAGKSVV